MGVTRGCPAPGEGPAVPFVDFPMALLSNSTYGACAEVKPDASRLRRRSNCANRRKYRAAMLFGVVAVLDFRLTGFPGGLRRHNFDSTVTKIRSR